MNPIFITIGNFEIRWYSLFILLAVIIVYTLINREATKFHTKKEFVFNLFFWTLIFGIIGARLYYVLFNLDMFKNDYFEILRVWNGGLAIHGGMIFGLLTIILYCKKYNVRVMRMLDFITVPLLLGQAIGRWGNFFNSEAHGAATTIAYLKSIHVPDFVINGMNIDGITYFPTFFFESAGCFIAFILLMILRRTRYTKVGTMTACYCIIYGTIRFFIEMSRTDALMLGAFKVAQIVSVALVLFGLGVLMLNSRKTKFEDLYNDKKNTGSIKF